MNRLETTRGARRRRLESGAVEPDGFGSDAQRPSNIRLEGVPDVQQFLRCDSEGLRGQMKDLRGWLFATHHPRVRDRIERIELPQFVDQRC